MLALLVTLMITVAATAPQAVAPAPAGPPPATAPTPAGVDMPPPAVRPLLGLSGGDFLRQRRTSDVEIPAVPPPGDPAKSNCRQVTRGDSVAYVCGDQGETGRRVEDMLFPE